MKKQMWVISVGGYGSIFFEGTEPEAEVKRAEKAIWEQGVGRKRLADADEIKTGIINQCKNHPNYSTKYKYKCGCSKCINNNNS